MTCGIYMIQNKVNNKIYIGQAVNIEQRWRTHKSSLNGKHHGNKHLQDAWNKYGEDNFEFTVICKCDENQLNTMEEYYIFELMSYDREIGYNKSYGGGSGRPTEESKKKMSEAQRGENNHNYGKHRSEETRKKIGESQKGERSPMYGKHLSEETRKKISETQKGKIAGENNPMYGKLGVKNPKAKPVVQLTLNDKVANVFESSQEAERKGFNHRHISACCQGKRKTHKGYKWMKLSEYIAKMNPNIKVINLFGKQYDVNQEVSI